MTRYDDPTRQVREYEQSWKDVDKAIADAVATRQEVIRLGQTEHQKLLSQHRKKMEIIAYAAEYELNTTREVAQARRQVNEETAQAIATNWFGHVTGMADVTRATFQAALGQLSAGITNELVEGTYDWRRAMRDVLKVMVQMTIKMLAMQAIARTIGASIGGFGGFLFHDGGPVLHSGGAVPPRKYHSGAVLTRREVPAVLERGEYVVNRRAVSRPGALRRLQEINAGAPAERASSVQETHFHYELNVQAIDAENMERAVQEKIIPLLVDAQRRGYYRPSE